MVSALAHETPVTEVEVRSRSRTPSAKHRCDSPQGLSRAAGVQFL